MNVDLLNWTGDARAAFGELLAKLSEPGSDEMSFHDMETLVADDGREVLRRVLHCRMELPARREPRPTAVVDAEGGPPRQLRPRAGAAGDHQLRRPPGAAAGLPPAGLPQPLPRRRRAQRAPGAIRARAPPPRRRRGQRDRSCRHRRGRARDHPAAPAATVLCLSFDGKGIVVRPSALRPGTAAAAERAGRGPARLSRDQKTGRKRRAELAAVFDTSPVPRIAADILGPPGQPRPQAPTASATWLTASVVEEAGTVIAEGFDEAERRDPGHRRTRVALVDRNNDQSKHIGLQARARRASGRIVADLIHVPDGAADDWVRETGLSPEIRLPTTRYRGSGSDGALDPEGAHFMPRGAGGPRRHGRLAGAGASRRTSQ